MSGAPYQLSVSIHADEGNLPLKVAADALSWWRDTTSSVFSPEKYKSSLCGHLIAHHGKPITFHLNPIDGWRCRSCESRLATIQRGVKK